MDFFYRTVLLKKKKKKDSATYAWSKRVTTVRSAIIGKAPGSTFDWLICLEREVS